MPNLSAKGKGADGAPLYRMLKVFAAVDDCTGISANSSVTLFFDALEMPDSRCAAREGEHLEPFVGDHLFRKACCAGKGNSAYAIRPA